MKRKTFSILFALVLVLSFSLIPAMPAMANDVPSSTMVFEGTLTDNGDGTYRGYIPMVVGGGYDVYAEEGALAWFGNDPGGGPVWTSQEIVDHDAWPGWDPNTPDWWQYSLNLHVDGGLQKWAVRNHPGATVANPWYDTAFWGSEKPPMGVPMSGAMDWTGMYAAETDVGAYLPSTGTAEIPGGAAGYGGGPMCWDMDWSWGSEMVPLQYPGFSVDVESLGSDEYRVTLTPALPSYGFVTGGGWIDSPPGAYPYQAVWEQGFEVDTDGWFGATRVSSGTNGITSASGDWHAEVTTDFTRWGGYSSSFPPGGYITSLDIYLDVDAGFTNDSRFDFTSAISTPGGLHLRDFIFNGGFYNDATGPGAGQNRFVFSASNNAPGWPKNPGRDPIAISSSGWYTFQHWFYDGGSGVLAVDLSIFDSVGNLVHRWTLSDPTDIIGSTVGGNRYGWFTSQRFDLPFLAIDNSFRAETPTGKASFGFVSKYKKGASVPDGQTQFTFQTADLNFHSNSYEWLVVTGSDYAKFKGSGTINGMGDYKFMLWAGDSDPDTFRIKIWYEVDDTEIVVYDNGMNLPIGGGNIVVHTSKK